MVAVLCGLVLVVLTGCTQDQGTSSDTPATTSSGSQPAGVHQVTVAAEGFQVVVGDVVVSGPAGVAAVGDKVTVEETELPEDLQGLGLSGSPLLSVAINDGSTQPTKPIRFQWDLPAGVDAETVAFVTRPSEGTGWDGVPVEVTDGMATAELEHLSWGWFVDAKKMAGDFMDNASKFLGQSFDPPEGCQQKVTSGATTVSLTNSTDLMHACVGFDGDDVVLRLAPDSPYMWLVAAASAQTKTFTPPSTIEGVVVGHLAVPLFLESYQGILQPGGGASLVLRGDQQHTVQFRISGALTQVPVLVTGVEMLLSMSGAAFPGDRELELANCILDSAQFVNASNDGEAGNAFLGVLECASQVIGRNLGADFGPLSIIVAILRSLSGHLVTGIRGLVDTFPTQQLVHKVVVTTTVAQPEWTLTTTGFGPLQYGKPIPDDLRKQFEAAWECIGPRIKHSKYGEIEVDTVEGDLVSRINRIILRDARASTASGARIGTTLTELKAMYGSKLTDHVMGNFSGMEVYRVPDGVSEDSSVSVYFEVIDGTVVSISLQSSVWFTPTHNPICGGP